MRMTAVLLDYGNVISKPQNEARVEQMARLTGLSTDALSEVYHRYRLDYDCGSLNGREYWMRILNRSSVCPTADLIGRLIQEDCLSWADTDARILEWVGRLKEDGYRTGILSNLPKELAEYTRSHFDRLDDFEVAFFSSEFKMVKPDREVYDYVIESLGVPAGEILFVDDRKENVDAARQLGIQSVLYESFEDLQDRLSHRYDLPLPG